MKKVILLFYYKLFSQCLLKIYILKPLWLHVLYNPFINFACQVFLLPVNLETRPIFVTSKPRNQAYFCGKHDPNKVYGWLTKCWPKLCLLE